MIIPLRIRKAEVAMADGRLDEAYLEAVREEIKNHRKGQRLVGRLARAFEKRSRDHLSAANPQAALSDAERAVRLGGNQPKILALRDAARTELDAQQSELQTRHQKISAARKCIASGDYSLGAKLCNDVDPGKTVVGLMQDAELNRRIVETALERGRKAIKASQWEVALDALDEARRMQPMQAEVTDFLSLVTQAVTQQVRAAIAKGRMDQAQLLLDRIAKHAPDSIDVRELTRVFSHCQSAAASARGVDMSPAVENLKSIKHILPEARWLDAAIKEAENVARGLENLRTGPLGSLVSVASGIAATSAGQPRSQAPSQPVMPTYQQDSVTIPEKFLIHLDGAGSFLVLRGSAAQIGTVSQSRSIDVPLQGQMGLPRLTVERLDDDYFLTSDASVAINGKPTTSKLLATGDQIRLGRRGSMHFAQPNAASTTATLDFAGIRLANGNARRVILMDDALVIGPQPSAHIQSLSLERAMVIHFRNGEMRIRPMSRTMETPGAVIALDQPHDIDGLSLVVANVG